MIDYSAQVHDNAKILILVMDRGRIAERGTYEELLAVNGLYVQLYEGQFRGRGYNKSISNTRYNEYI